ncbi:MAG TPA: hypothetical protein VG820_08215 [Fimbriimonadaceae bacterium]|nr:hypothetical protein [Fimbriimonadaceae bacterium]
MRKKTYGEPSKPALPSQDMLPEIEAFEIIPMIANNLIASATPEAVKSHARALATLANNGAFSLANLRAVSNIAFEQKGRAQTWMRLLATYLQHMVRNRP